MFKPPGDEKHTLPAPKCFKKWTHGCAEGLSSPLLQDVTHLLPSKKQHPLSTGNARLHPPASSLLPSLPPSPLSLSKVK